MQKQVISFAQVINFCKISSARGVFNPETPLRTPLLMFPPLPAEVGCESREQIVLLLVFIAQQ